MSKFVFIVFMILVMVSTVSAEEYKSGGIIELYKIEQCAGPVSVKVTSEVGIEADEMKIEKCTYGKDNIWVCNCNGYFNVKLLTPSDTKNIYDFTIQYYVEYPDIDETGNISPSVQEIERDNFKQVVKKTNVIIQPGKPLKRLFNIDMETKNAFLFAVLLFLFIIGIAVFKGKKIFAGKGKTKSNDVMSYKVTKDEDMESDVQDILNHIK